MIVKTKTRIVLDKVYQVGDKLELNEEQYKVLKDYVEVVKTEAPKPKEEVKPKKASTKAKVKE